MSTRQINSTLSDATAEIRSQVKTQVQVWQQIPHWTLEAQGRRGWNDNANLTYRYGLLGIDNAWPHRLFVELSTGRLLVNKTSRLEEAPDNLVLEIYARNSESFDAQHHLLPLVKTATGPSFMPDKAINDQRREELRRKYNVKRKWKKPATAITYRY